ncbi:TLD-domain-containing protein [Rhizophagus diaphanus]|nr:TLD-domain-containing protein [Rhizophagus diaphanus] [Rhizophagus sp. MUCL 43196]
MGNNNSSNTKKRLSKNSKPKHDTSNISLLSPNGRISRISNELLKRKFSQIESYSLRASFDNLSTINERGIAHISKGAFIGYLGFPDDIGAGPLIYRSFTYLANYPSVGHTNALLTYDGLIKAVAVYCNLTEDIINEDRVKLLFDSFSISDNDVHNEQKDPLISSESSISQIPQIVTPEDTEFLKAIGFYETDHSKISKVRKQDMVKILTGLIWLMSSEMSSINASSEELKQNLKKIISPKFINQIHEDAVHVVEHMVRYDNSTNIKSNQVITWLTFSNFIERNAPNIFRGFLPFIYGQFLIGLTLSQQRSDTLFQGPKVQYWPKLDLHSDILNQMNMGLLSWMLPESVIKRRYWNCLYSSSKHGFSMNRFHRNVFKYPGPTLMLIHADIDISSQRRKSVSSISSGAGKNEVMATSKNKKHVNTLLLGAYVADPWKSTSNPKTCFGSEECALFEVLPVFEKFPATKFNSNYVYYNPSFGIGFGGIATSSITSNVITTSERNSFSLQVDNTLQFGRYRNDAAHHEIKPTYRLSATRQYFDIPFEVIEIEVFGLGGDLAKEKQEKEWEWEEAEAAKRSGFKRSGNKEEDKEILKLAGIIDEDSRKEIQIWES